MDSGLIKLMLASAAFVGSHLVMSHPLRAGLVQRLGEKGFLGLYSLISFATMGGMVVSFRAVGPAGALLWDGSGNGPWMLASLLTLLGITLLIGSLKGNPAAPQVDPAMVAHARATGVYAVTRHPMMWGMALWAIAHALVSPSPRVLVLTLAIGALALLGAAGQDAKKKALLGEAWAHWQGQTTYWPRLTRLGAIPPAQWALGLVVWLGATYGHVHGVPVLAGLWRWLL
jgi:uncharacterized membrane protein